jgi:prepilin-type N-terminal cleavage/methylation domain-containing protein
MGRFGVRRFKAAAPGDDQTSGESGFTLIEMLIAMMLFAIVSTPLLGVLMASASTQRLARERTLAQEAAMAQIESIRALPYASVGTVNGNPAGLVVATRALVLTGLTATMTTRVSFVNDPSPTSYVTEADYKKVVVTVVRTRDSRQLTQEATYVSPPGRDPYGGINGTIIRAQVVDYALNTALSTATVSLATGPSAPRSDFTDPAGSVTFAGLTANQTTGPQAYYDVTASLSGYATLKDDVSPASAAHVQLAPGQTFGTVLRMYRPATIYLVVNAPTGGLYPGTATVTVSSPRGAQAFPVTGGTATVNQINGEPVVPGLRYTVSAQTAVGNFAPALGSTVPNSYPNDLTSTFTLQLSAPAATQTVNVKVQTVAGVAVKSANVELSGGPLPVDIAGVTDASGNVTFAVPAGAAYTVVAKGTSGEGTGTWTGSVTTSPTAITVKVA